MNTHTDPEKLYEHIWSELNDSMSTIESGGDITMAGIDQNVRDLCGMISTLSPEKAKEYDAKIANIIGYLTQIVDKLNKRKMEIGEKIDVVSQRSRAQAAYGAALLNNLQGK